MFRWPLFLCNQPCTPLQMARLVRLLRQSHILHGRCPVLLPSCLVNRGQMAHGLREDHRSRKSPKQQDRFRGLAIQQIASQGVFPGSSILHDVLPLGGDRTSQRWLDCFRPHDHRQFWFHHRPVHTFEHGIWSSNCCRYNNCSIFGKIHRSNYCRMLYALAFLCWSDHDVCHPGRELPRSIWRLHPDPAM